ncbi:MAG: ferrous iron transporter B [Clostridiales bacterium]|nr:ferrous iron transporter B [Clostridiales bacterium]
MRIALTGNPNSGKTTMYNALTGQNEKVGNWAGVTVERKEHAVRRAFCGAQEEIIAVDLPGAYSMSPFTSEESITSQYVRNEHPDVIINIVDATNLSRSLFFTTQLLELGIPLVVALNKADVNERKHTSIDTLALSTALGCPVVDTVSTSQEGLAEVVKAAVGQVGKQPRPPYQHSQVDMTDRAAVERADRARFAYVGSLVKQVEQRSIRTSERNRQDQLDAVLTHPVAGLLIFAAVMFFVFWCSQSFLGPLLADTLTAWLEAFQGFVDARVAGSSAILHTLLVDGVIGGVIAVVGFLPLVMVMYFLIALLEDCGYLARATVVMAPLFRKVGLSGKSVIPFIMATGCAIPGVMACRTIRNDRERRATAMLAPFMPCGAKLPVIALFAGAFFADSPWVSPLMYFAGIVMILLGALIINAVTGYRARTSYFIMELPEYKAPSLRRACRAMLSRGWAYIVKAGTIILLCNTLVQVTQMFDWSFRLVEDGAADTSILASIAGPVAYALIPIVGYHAWQLTAAAFTGLVAKENVVGTLAVCYGISSLIDTQELALAEGAGTQVATIMGLTKAAALAYLMFNLFSPPCFAAIGAMNAEMKSARWLWGGIALQLGMAYTVAFLVYQLGTLLTTGQVGAGFLPGLMGVLAMAAALTGIIFRNSRRMKAKALLKAKEAHT